MVILEDDIDDYMEKSNFINLYRINGMSGY